MTTNTETIATNAERMVKLDDAWNARDWDTFDDYHDGNSVVVYWPGQEDNPTHGGHDHRAEAQRFCAAFPDNRVHLKRVGRHSLADSHRQTRVAHDPRASGLRKRPRIRARPGKVSPTSTDLVSCGAGALWVSDPLLTKE
jgi:SnoaL-like polyketide cyclase